MLTCKHREPCAISRVMGPPAVLHEGLAEYADLQLGSVEQAVSTCGWDRVACYSLCSLLFLFGLLLPPVLGKLLAEGRLGMRLCIGIAKGRPGSGSRR